MASKFTITAELNLQTKNLNQVVGNLRQQFQNANLNIKIKDLANAQAQVNKLSSGAKDASKNMGLLGSSINQAFKRFTVITAVTGTIVGFTRALKNSIGDAIEFEREIVKIAQATGQTVGQLKGLVGEINSVSTSFGVSSKELILAARSLTQAGFAADKVSGALKILAQTELAATFDSIQDTTEGAIALLNQFGREAQKTGNEVAFLEKSFSAINQVSKEFAVESSDLVTAIRTTGSAFETAGGSLNELIALFTSVRSTTRESAESIATGFRTIFTRVQRVDTINALRNLGIELQDAEGKFIGPMEAVKRLSVALSTIDPKDFRFNLVVEELGGFRQVSKVIPLIQQFAVAQNALNVAQGSSGSLAKDAQTAQQSLAIQIQKTREEFSKFIRELVGSSSFQETARFLLDLAGAFIRVADSIKPLVPLIAQFSALKLGLALLPTMASFSGPRKKALGGPIHFATGGLVPGSGNGDTVPAMLSPGEFVIRKSSVKKLGVDNLARANKYATGGVVDLKSARAYTVPSLYTFNKDSEESLSSSLTRKDKPLKFNPNDQIKADIKRVGIDPEKLSKKNELSRRAYETYKKSPSAQERGFNFEKLLEASGSFIKDGRDPSSRIDGFNKIGQLVEVKSTLEKVSDNALLDDVIGGAIRQRGETEQVLAKRAKTQKLTENPETIDFEKIYLYYDKTSLNSRSDKIKKFALGGPAGKSSAARPITIPRPADYTFDKPAGIDLEAKNSKSQMYKLNAEDRLDYDRENVNVDVNKLTNVSKGLREAYEGATKPDIRGYRFEDILIESGLAKSRSKLSNARLDGITPEGNPFEAKSTKEALNIVDFEEKLYGAISDNISEPEQLLRKRFNSSKLTDGQDDINVGKVTVFQDVTSGLGTAVKARARMGYEEEEATKRAKEEATKQAKEEGQKASDRLKEIVDKNFASGYKITGTQYSPIGPKGLHRDVAGLLNKKLGASYQDKITSMSDVEIASALSDIIVKKANGGAIARFATGGAVPNAPLVDDILQATGAILPHPDKAVQAIIQAGGGAVDMDRTLKRTIGDLAYAKAKTKEEKSEVLTRYFRDDAKRLQDVKSAPLTGFGKALKSAIESRQINPNKISIISKSGRTKGLAEYLSSLFGIPTANMIFTEGKSKQPALDAFREKGPRAERISRFATGGFSSGTDTVPAMLTPGEFVINKKSAQKIGSATLNRMNKVGKFAAGGPVGGVQHFAAGAKVQAFEAAQKATYASDPQMLKFIEILVKQLEILEKKGMNVTAAIASMEKSLNIFGGTAHSFQKSIQKDAQEAAKTPTKLQQARSTKGQSLGGPPTKDPLTEKLEKMADGSGRTTTNLLLLAGVTESVVAQFSNLSEEQKAAASAFGASLATYLGIASSLKEFSSGIALSNIKKKQENLATIGNTTAKNANTTAISQNTGATTGNTASKSGGASGGFGVKALTIADGALTGFSVGMSAAAAASAYYAKQAEKSAKIMTDTINKFKEDISSVGQAELTKNIVDSFTSAGKSKIVGEGLSSKRSVGIIAGGAVAGAARGGQIGAAFGPKGIAAGVVIGGIIGGLTGFGIALKTLNVEFENRTKAIEMSGEALSSSLYAAEKGIKKSQQFLQNVDKKDSKQIVTELDNTTSQYLSSVSLLAASQRNAIEAFGSMEEIPDEMKQGFDSGLQSLKQFKVELEKLIAVQTARKLQEINTKVGTQGFSTTKEISSFVESQRKNTKAVIGNELQLKNASIIQQLESSGFDPKAIAALKNSLQSLTNVKTEEALLKMKNSMLDASVQIINQKIALEKELRARELVLGSLNREIAMSDAFANFKFALEQNANSLKAIDAVYEGTVSGLKSNIAELSALDISSPIESNKEAVQKAFEQIGSSFGPAGKEVANNLSDLQKVVPNLETTLNAIGADAFSDPAKLDKSIADLISNLGVDNKGAVAQGLTKALQAGFSSKELSTREGISGQQEAIKRVLETFKDFSGKLTERGKAILEVFKNYEDRSREIYDKILQSQLREVEIRLKGVEGQKGLAENIARARGKSLSLEESDRFRAMRQRQLAGTSAGDPSAIGAILDGLRKTLGKGGLEDEVNKNLQLEAKKLEKALGELADQSDRTSDIMSKIDEARAKRETVQSALTDYAFSTGEERAKKDETFRALSAAISMGDLQAIPQEMIGSVSSLLKEFSDIQIPGAGGMTGKQLQKEFTAREFEKMGQFDAAKLARAELSTPEEKLIAELKKTAEIEVAARESFIKQETDLQNANTNALMDLTKALRESIAKVPEREAQLNKVGAEQIQKFGQRADIGKLEAEKAAVQQEQKPIEEKIKKIEQFALDLSTAIDKATTEYRKTLQEGTATVQGKASGGLIYRAGGGSIFQPKGTDTVPAMLTPGEFVIKKSSVDKIGVDNLNAINNGYAKGGLVSYFANGGKAPSTLDDLAKRVAKLEEQVKDLQKENKILKSTVQINQMTNGVQNMQQTVSEMASQPVAGGFGVQQMPIGLMGGRDSRTRARQRAKAREQVEQNYRNNIASEANNGQGLMSNQRVVSTAAGGTRVVTDVRNRDRRAEREAREKYHKEYKGYGDELRQAIIKYRENPSEYENSLNNNQNATPVVPAPPAVPPATIQNQSPQEIERIKSIEAENVKKSAALSQYTHELNTYNNASWLQRQFMSKPVDPRNNTAENFGTLDNFSAFRKGEAPGQGEGGLGDKSLEFVRSAGIGLGHSAVGLADLGATITDAAIGGDFASRNLTATKDFAFGSGQKSKAGYYTGQVIGDLAQAGRGSATNYSINNKALQGFGKAIKSGATSKEGLLTLGSLGARVTGYETAGDILSASNALIGGRNTGSKTNNKALTSTDSTALTTLLANNKLTRGVGSSYKGIKGLFGGTANATDEVAQTAFNRGERYDLLAEVSKQAGDRANALYRAGSKDVPNDELINSVLKRGDAGNYRYATKTPEEVLKAAGVEGFAKGGAVDSIPAMLTPGEYVMNTKAVNKHGKAFMDHLNKGGQVLGFQSGGPVGYYQSGGSVGGLSNMAELFSGFMAQFQEISKMMTGMTMTHTVTVDGQLNIGGINAEGIANQIRDAIGNYVGEIVTRKFDEFKGRAG